MSGKIILLFIFVLYSVQKINAKPGLYDLIDADENFLNPTISVDVMPSVVPTLNLERKKYAFGLFFKANWFRAAQYCRYRGMALASINDETEEAELEALMESIGFELTPLWTSGTDIAEEGKYFWMSSGSPITYTKWYRGEPSGGTNENCLAITPYGGEGYVWDDAACSQEFNFICEYYPSLYKDRELKSLIYV